VTWPRRASAREWLVDLGLAVLVAAPGWLPLLQGRLVGTHDGYFHLYRLFELDRAVRAGDLYPRWAPDFALGYGYPVFNYYSPLMLYLAEPWRLLGAGLIVSLDLAQVIAILLAIAGMYGFVRGLFGRLAGLVAAVLYGTLPYLLVDVYVRGAVAETLALALLPWVAWSLRSAAGRPSRVRVAAAALAVGALVLAHNITSLIALPVLAVLGLLELRRVPRSGWPLLGVAASGALGLGLAAFYWLPALLERDFVHNERLTTLFYDYHNQFQPLGELVQRTLYFSYRYDAFANFLFKPGLVQLVVAALGGTIGLVALRGWRAELALMGVVAIGGLALLTSRSAPVWDALPLLAYVQFPWRLLSLVGFATALLAASAVAAVRRERVRALVVAALVLPWVWASYADLRPALLDLREDEIGRGSLNRIELDRKLIGTTTIGEYTPSAVTRDLFEGWRDEFPVTAGSVRAVSAKPVGATGISVAVEAPTDGELVLDQFAFPGWAATVDGRPAATRPLGPRGLLAVDVPAGAQEVTVQMASTPIRTAGWVISAGAILVAAALLAGRAPRRAGVAAATAAAALLPALGHASQSAVFVATAPGAPLAAFEGGPRLLGGREEGAGGVTLLWSADAPVVRSLDVALRLIDDQGTVVARRDEPPRFGLRPTHTWRPGTVVRDAADLTALPDAPIEPGRAYQLVVGLHDDGGYVAPTEGHVVRWTDRCPCAASGPEGIGVVVGQAQAAPPRATPAPFMSAARRVTLAGPTVVGGRIELASVAVDVEHPTPPALDRLLARLANRIPLLRGIPASDPDHSALGGPAGVLATLDPGGTFLVVPTWRSLADVPADYAVFVHLLDNRQQLFAQDDEWPRRGFSPTSQWHTGQVTPDGYHVRIPPDAPPGAFTVALGLYTRGDFKRLAWSGEPSGRDQLVLGRVKVRPRASAQPPVAGPSATFGGAIRLEGFAGLPTGRSALKPGAALPVRPRWRSIAPVEHDLTTFVQLLDANGKLVASGDAQPLGGRYPTSLWEPGEEIDDAYQVVVPPGTTGPVKLIVGLYRLETGERLRTDEGADFLSVASFDVAP
jgi:hypothetical protein